MVELSILDNKLSVNQFRELQCAVGFGDPQLAQTEAAIRNSLYVVSVMKDGMIAGMGRLIGDCARICYVQDLFVKPEFQHQGIGHLILHRLLDYVRDHGIKGTIITIGLMSAKGKEGFYESLGFRTRPNDREGAGMVYSLMIE